MDTKNKLIISNKIIENKIFLIGEQRLMLDKDLAELYQVETRVLNQAVKRNIERFPEDFMFQLSKDEFESLKSQFVTSNTNRGGVRKLPNVFTEQGVSMLATVLNSKIAINISIQIIRIFVSFRKFTSENVLLFQKVKELENKFNEHDNILKQLVDTSMPTTEGIFYDGQIFDAYVFISKLIKNAKTSIVLVDNYIDESVLLQLSKRRAKVKATIYTAKITKQFQLDIAKFNSQYPEIKINIYTKSHDRFLIIDNKHIYHIGASLKDLGKKWFAFSKIQLDIEEMINKLKPNKNE